MNFAYNKDVEIDETNWSTKGLWPMAYDPTNTMQPQMGAPLYPTNRYKIYRINGREPYAAEAIITKYNFRLGTTLGTTLGTNQ